MIIISSYSLEIHLFISSHTVSLSTSPQIPGDGVADQIRASNKILCWRRQLLRMTVWMAVYQTIIIEQLVDGPFH